MATPITLVDSGGIAITNVPNAVPMTPAQGAVAVTLVDSGGLPVTLVNEDGSEYEEEPELYLGPVATRTGTPQGQNSTFKYAMTRSFHYSTDDISSLKIVLPAFQANFETGPGADVEFTAAIEYPAGTFNQVLFGGQAMGTCPNRRLLESDWCTLSVPIPNKTKFWVRAWQHSPGTNGVVFSGLGRTGDGDGAIFSATATADLTMGGTVTASASPFHPYAILGMTEKATMYMIGDSRLVNGGFDANGNLGEIARSLGSDMGYINCGVSGDTADQIANGSTNETLTGNSSFNRLSVAQYCTHGIVEPGTNDLAASVSDANLRIDIETIRTALPAAMKKYLPTIEPRTGGTSVSADGSDQTLVASEPVRLTHNTWRRTVPTGFEGCIDITTVNELAPQPTGKWIAANTDDGVHANATGLTAIVTSGIVDPETFVR